MPEISSYTVDEPNRVTVQWKLDDLADVKGFRVFQNGSIVAGEDILKKDTRSFTTASLKDDEKYVYTLQVITQNGLESPVSYPLNVLLYKKGKN